MELAKVGICDSDCKDGRAEDVDGARSSVMTVVSVLTIVTHVKRLGLIENPGCDTGYDSPDCNLD
jgi:hypothetical protein